MYQPPMADEMREMLLQALGEPIGLLVQTNSPERLIGRLRDAKKSMNDPDLERVQIRRVDHDGGQVALTKGFKVAGSGAGPEAMGL